MKKPKPNAAQRTPVASMARGTARKPKDNLALDAMDARAAGMTYGKWKALHPHTKAANEPRLAQKPKPKPKQPAGPREHVVICEGCGVRFVTTIKNKKYCTAHCRQRKKDAESRAQHRKTTKEAAL